LGPADDHIKPARCGRRHRHPHIAIRAAASSAPDRHTLYMALASNFIALPQMQANLPFDVGCDFVPIGFVGEHPMVIAAGPALGVNTLSC
jgi:tripartite-type tricarboxylate transporter receptor subunit TctC